MGISQYQVAIINLDPTIGSEIKKTRPCVIVSPDEMNNSLRTIVACPMTTKGKKYPTRVAVNYNDINGWIAVDQIRTIDKKRIVKVTGLISNAEISNLKSVIKEAYVD